MNKWAKPIAIAVLAIAIMAANVWMYATWSDCRAVGGTTVRGMFWLECIR